MSGSLSRTQDTAVNGGKAAGDLGIPGVQERSLGLLYQVVGLAEAQRCCAGFDAYARPWCTGHCGHHSDWGLKLGKLQLDATSSGIPFPCAITVSAVGSLVGTCPYSAPHIASANVVIIVCTHRVDPRHLLAQLSGNVHSVSHDSPYMTSVRTPGTQYL